MVAPKDFLGGLGEHGGGVQGALAAIRAEHGKGARAYLAGLTGVSKDTAGRWLSGKQSPNVKAGNRVRDIRKAGDRIRNAKRIRSMRNIRPRLVSVASTSPGKNAPDGFRQVGGSIDLAGVADAIADAWAAGNEDEAAEMLSHAIMNGYGGDDPTDQTDGLGSLLTVTNFEVDPGVSYDE